MERLGKPRTQRPPRGWRHHTARLPHRGPAIPALAVIYLARSQAARSGCQARPGRPSWRAPPSGRAPCTRGAGQPRPAASAASTGTSRSARHAMPPRPRRRHGLCFPEAAGRAASLSPSRSTGECPSSRRNGRPGRKSAEPGGACWGSGDQPDGEPDDGDDHDGQDGDRCSAHAPARSSWPRTVSASSLQDAANDATPCRSSTATTSS